MSRIHTGLDFPKNAKDFDYKKFAGQMFAFMFGFKHNDPRLKIVCTIDEGEGIPQNFNEFSFVIDTGGEIDYINTQREYLDQHSKLKSLLQTLHSSDKPFFLTCATHQFLAK